MTTRMNPAQRQPFGQQLELARVVANDRLDHRPEFGAKLSISVVGGFSFVDRRSWDNYNEGGDLLEQIEIALNKLPTRVNRQRDTVLVRAYGANHRGIELTSLDSNASSSKFSNQAKENYPKGVSYPSPGLQ